MGSSSGNKRLIESRLAQQTLGVSGAPDSVCDNTYEDDYSQLLDNEILTPVNETDFFLGSCGIGEGCPQSSNIPLNRNLGKPFGGHTSGGNLIDPPPVINEIPNSTSKSAYKFASTAAAIDGSERQESYSGSSGQQYASKKMLLHIQDGKYKGEAIHNDGNVIDIIYTVSCQTLPSGRVHCVWVSRDPDTELNRVCKSGADEIVEGEEEDEERNQNLTLTFDSVNSTIENSLGQAIRATAQSTTAASTIATTSNVNALSTRGGGVATSTSRPNSMSLLSQCEEELIAGEFSRYYLTLKQIGKGAYGYVKMAYRNTDRLLVIAKFILKEKLCPQFMVVAEDKREIPMEIYLLTTVEHPNIVRVLDVFENDKFYQLVMEKHGCGMDLFEFIDRLPMMDEKLACYIFRQIANAVDYLHSLHILHRDLKDENIIIDQNFHVKLIDFGSATFMEEGKLFSTFYGTTEYCSPEVLAGNKYAGPELEMWSLGVTLYVIMFFENPFVDIEETLHASLVIPQKVSGQLEHLLMAMLDKNPVTRCTMTELMADPWVNQEINAALFNFAWVVSCEAYESNPDKYYNGQVLSSGTAISTTSPQDSLSLVDGDSMLDVDGDEDEAVEIEEGVLDKTDKPEEIEYSSKETKISPPNSASGGVGSNPMLHSQSIIIHPHMAIATKSAVCGLSNPRLLSPGNNSSVPKCAGFTLSISDSSPNVETLDETSGECQRIRHSNKPFHIGDQGRRKRSKRTKQKKRNSRKGRPKEMANNSENRGGAPSGLALSKSENNLYEKGMRLVCEDGGVVTAYDGVVCSMRDLQFDASMGQNSTKAMNDLSRNQVLNTIAVSTEAIGCSNASQQLLSENYNINNLEDERCNAKSGWTATVELTPKSTNRSNFEILSISYNHHGDYDEDEECYEDGYENDSWDDEEEPEAKEGT